MERFYLFLVDNWALSFLWIALFVALIVHLKKKAGSALSVHEATMLINRSDAQVLDIRDKKAFDKGHIVDAVNIPLQKLEERIAALGKKKERPVIVVCQMGHHSGDAVKKLETAGFTAVHRLHGGMTEWQSQGLPVVT